MRSPACNAACGGEHAAGLPVGTSTVCDDTCAGKSTRFDGFLCGAGDTDRFGSMCRLCFVDGEEARRQEQSLALTRSDLEGGKEASHVVMCDTMRPPEAAECSDKCGRKKDTVREQLKRHTLGLMIGRARPNRPSHSASAVIHSSRCGLLWNWLSRQHSTHMRYL